VEQPSDRNDAQRKRQRTLYTLAMVNAAIWALAMIALAFVVQGAPSARGLYVIMAAGTSVSVVLISTIRRSG
jgi:hypothetical protein